MKNIVLIGMMGAGKTTIGNALASRLHKDMIDMDEYIEKKYDMSISEMFEISEEYFREKETQCALEVSKSKDMIISAGGGIIKKPQNMETLSQNGIVIYIDRPIIHILKDINVAHRPLLKDGKEKLNELYDQRHELYMHYADYHFVNDRTIEDIVDKILEVI